MKGIEIHGGGNIHRFPGGRVDLDCMNLRYIDPELRKARLIERNGRRYALEVHHLSRSFGDTVGGVV